MALAKPKAQATHVRVIRNTGAVRTLNTIPSSRLENIIWPTAMNQFTADKKPGTITVRVEGRAAKVRKEYVLPMALAR